MRVVGTEHESVCQQKDSENRNILIPSKTYKDLYLSSGFTSNQSFPLLPVSYVIQHYPTIVWSFPISSQNILKDKALSFFRRKFDILKEKSATTTKSYSTTSKRALQAFFEISQMTAQAKTCRNNSSTSCSQNCRNNV